MTSALHVACCSCFCCGKVTKHAAGSKDDCCGHIAYRLVCLLVPVIVILNIMIWELYDVAILAVFLIITCSVLFCCVICNFPIIIIRQLLFGFQSSPPHSTDDEESQNMVSSNIGIYDTLLRKYVTDDGNVKYRDWMSSDEDVNSLKQWIYTLSIEGPQTTPDRYQSDGQKLKYYINAYNALVLYGVIHCSSYFLGNKQHDEKTEEVTIPLIDSVMIFPYQCNKVIDGSGFFYAQRFKLDGQGINLYDLGTFHGEIVQMTVTSLTEDEKISFRLTY